MSYILGITPARGGSKGIPGKNIKAIAGKPLIAWTIESAKESKMLDKYVVSTEAEEIARVVREYRADVIKRPMELATDEASTLCVLQHLVENIPCDIIVLLQATSPLRRPGLIDECVKEFIDNDYDSLATGFICDYIEYGKNELRRQDIQGFFPLSPVNRVGGRDCFSFQSQWSLWAHDPDEHGSRHPTPIIYLVYCVLRYRDLSPEGRFYQCFIRIKYPQQYLHSDPFEQTPHDLENSTA